MKAEQKVLRLGSESGNPISITDNILLVVNGVKTNLKAMDFFKRYEQEEHCIIGYSIFGDKPLLNNVIQVPAPDSTNIQVNFWNKNTDEEIFISLIKNPMFQLGDREVDEQSAIEKLIAEVLKQKPEEIIEVKEEKIDISEKLDIKKDIEEEEEEEEKLDEELVCSEYEIIKKKLVEKGYKEYSLGNMRLLVEGNGGERIALCELLDEKDYSRIKIEKHEKTEIGYKVGVTKGENKEIEWIEFVG